MKDANQEQLNNVVAFPVKFLPVPEAHEIRLAKDANRSLDSVERIGLSAQFNEVAQLHRQAVMHKEPIAQELAHAFTAFRTALTHKGETLSDKERKHIRRAFTMLDDVLRHQAHKHGNICANMARHTYKGCLILNDVAQQVGRYYGMDYIAKV